MLPLITFNCADLQPCCYVQKKAQSIPVRQGTPSVDFIKYLVVFVMSDPWPWTWISYSCFLLCLRVCSLAEITQYKVELEFIFHFKHGHEWEPHLSSRKFGGTPLGLERSSTLSEAVADLAWGVTSQITDDRPQLYRNSGLCLSFCNVTHILIGWSGGVKDQI